MLLVFISFYGRPNFIAIYYSNNLLNIDWSGGCLPSLLQVNKHLNGAAFYNTKKRISCFANSVAKFNKLNCHMQPGKLLKCDYLRPEVFQLNWKYPVHVKISLAQYKRKSILVLVFHNALSIMGPLLFLINGKVYMTQIFFINLSGRAFKKMMNGIYFFVNIAFLVAEVFKILIYTN